MNIHILKHTICLLLCLTAATTYAAEGDATRGGELFARYGCYQCHQYSGAGYQGAPGGATLTPLRFPVDAFIAYLRNPPQANRMPPYTEQVLSETEARDLHAFIAALPQPRPVEEIELLREIAREIRNAD